MCKTGNIINGRPLTKVSDGPNDLVHLTPNHLLLLRQIESLSHGLLVKEYAYSRRRWRDVPCDAGNRNTLLYYRSDKRGYNQGETSLLEVFFFTYTIQKWGIPNDRVWIRVRVRVRVRVRLRVGIYIKKIRKAKYVVIFESTRSKGL